MMFNTVSSRITLAALEQRSLLGALVGLTLAGINAGCAGEDLEQRDLGNTNPPLTSSDDPPAASDRTPVVGSDGWIDSFVEGHWVGHAEDLFAPADANGERPIYNFPSGSTDFTLDISLADPTTPNGQIVFGTGLVPTPLAGVSYPPGFDAEVALPLISLELPLPPLEGLQYQLIESIQRNPVNNGAAAGALALSYVSNEAYSSWCLLQPAHPRDDGAFDCLTLSEPNDPSAQCSTTFPDGSEERYDCAISALCKADNVCSCTETGCNAVPGKTSHLWLIRDGEDLIGTWVGAAFDYGSPGRFLPVGSVRFQRL